MCASEFQEPKGCLQAGCMWVLAQLAGTSPGKRCWTLLLTSPALFQSTVRLPVSITIDCALGASQGFKFTELAGYLTKPVAAVVSPDCDLHPGRGVSF